MYVIYLEVSEFAEVVQMFLMLSLTCYCLSQKISWNVLLLHLVIWPLFDCVAVTSWNRCFVTWSLETMMFWRRKEDLLHSRLRSLVLATWCISHRIHWYYSPMKWNASIHFLSNDFGWSQCENLQKINSNWNYSNLLDRQFCFNDKVWFHFAFHHCFVFNGNFSQYFNNNKFFRKFKMGYGAFYVIFSRAPSQYVTPLHVCTLILTAYSCNTDIHLFSRLRFTWQC